MRNRRGRPCQRRRINFAPRVRYFKPQGVKMSDLELVNISLEELEAIRLKNIQELDQRECADRMKTSPATFQRILVRANQKIAKALSEGKAIKIEKE